MTAQAYDEYVKKCKQLGTKPSKLEDLNHDTMDDQSKHEYKPVHIRKPRDFTGKDKTSTEQLNELPEDGKQLMTKKQHKKD